MKTKSLILSFSFLFSFVIHSQSVTAPISNGSTTQTKAPNGFGHKTLRALYYIPQSEINTISNNSTIQSMSFNLINGRDIAYGNLQGTIEVYIQNTTDSTNLKPNIFSDIVNTMTLVYNGFYTIPATNNSISINMPFNSPFVYNGNSLYVAINYFTNDALPIGNPTQVATYKADNSLQNSCFSTSSSTSTISNSLSTVSSFRPEMTFFILPLSNNTFSQNELIAIYPNPSNNIIKILNNSKSKITGISFFDINGKKIMHHESELKNIDISSLMKGLYFVQIDLEMNPVFLKFVKD